MSLLYIIKFTVSTEWETKVSYHTREMDRWEWNALYETDIEILSFYYLYFFRSLFCSWFFLCIFSFHHPECSMKCGTRETSIFPGKSELVRIRQNIKAWRWSWPYPKTKKKTCFMTMNTVGMLFYVKNCRPKPFGIAMFKGMEEIFKSKKSKHSLVLHSCYFVWSLNVSAGRTITFEIHFIIEFYDSWSDIKWHNTFAVEWTTRSHNVKIQRTNGEGGKEIKKTSVLSKEIFKE